MKKINNFIPIFILFVGSMLYVVYMYYPVVFPSPISNQQLVVPKFSASLIKKMGNIAQRSKTLRKEMEKGKFDKKEINVSKQKKLTDPFSFRVAVVKKELVQPGSMPENPQPYAQNELRLEGIIIDEELRMAVISGQTLPPGSKINGWTVSAIFNNRVILTSKSNQIKVLKMGVK
ncbi:MAG: hypothetical protein WCV91_05250 [Candidatus Margulisiibacteriota bacterium]